MAIITFYTATVDSSPIIHDEKTKKLNDELIWLEMFNFVLISVSHWLFSVEYLKLALKFPLLLCQLQDEEIKARQRRNSWILFGLNMLFYTQLTLWTTLTLAIGKKFMIIFYLEFLNPFLPALLLIFSIYRVKISVKKLNWKEVKTREKLMRVHTYTFIFFIIVNVAMSITTYKAIQVREDNKQGLDPRCKYSVA